MGVCLFSTLGFLTMSMLIPISYSCRNLYLAALRFMALWLEKVRLPQTSALPAYSNNLGRSFHRVAQPDAPAAGRVRGLPVNRAFLMRFAALTSNENLKYIYETRQSTAPPESWRRWWRRTAPSAQGRLRTRIQGTRTEKTRILPENHRPLQRRTEKTHVQRLLRPHRPA